MSLNQNLLPTSGGSQSNPYKTLSLLGCVTTIGLAIALIVVATSGNNGVFPQRSFDGFPVMDTHMHISNWSQVNTTYTGGLSLFSWFHEDYVREVREARLKPTRAIMVALFGVPADNRLTQSQYVQGIADQLVASGSDIPIAGIVTTISCIDNLGSLSDWEEFLRVLSETVPLNVGFRCIDFPRVEMEIDETRLAAWQMIADRGYSFDAYTGGDTTALDKVAFLAQSVPDLNIIINHMSCAGVAGRDLPEFDTWAPAMEKAATFPRVYVKISGAGSVSDPGNVLENTRPYVELCIKNFGYKRSIYASNWYNSNGQDGFMSYRSWADAVGSYLMGLDATTEEIEWVLDRAGAEAYGLEPQ